MKCASPAVKTLTRAFREEWQITRIMYPRWLSFKVVGIGLCVALAYLIWRGPILSYEGRSLDEWLVELGNNGSQFHSEAFAALNYFGPRATPRLVQIIRSPMSASGGARWNTVRAFEHLKEKATPAIPELENLMNQGNQDAAVALGYIGSPAVPALVNALDQTNNVMQGKFSLNRRWLRNINYAERIPQNAMHGLILMGTNARVAVPPLIRLAQDKARHPWARTMALATLGVVGSNSVGVVPVMIEALRSPDTHTVSVAAESLRNFPAATNRTLEPLLSVMRRTKDEYTRRNAGETLFKLGARSELAPILLVQVTSTNVETRTWVAQTLGQVEAKLETILPGVAVLARDTNAAVRAAAVLTMGSCGVKESSEIALLLETLKDNDPIVVNNTMHALSGIEPGRDYSPEWHAQNAQARLRLYPQWTRELSECQTAPQRQARKFANYFLGVPSQ